MAQADLAYVNMLADVQKNELKIQEFFSKTLEKMIVLERSNFVFTTLAKKISLPKKQGTKTWTVRRYLHLPVDLDKGALAEGIAPTPMKVEGKKVSATIKQYGAYIEETDVSVDIHFDSIMSIYQPELARHAAETIERDLLAALASESSVRFTGDATSNDTIEIADVLTFAEVRRAWLRMRNYHREGHSAYGGAPVLVSHINVIQDLIDDATLKDYIVVPGYDETPIRNGSLTQFKIYGVNFVETLVLDPVANAGGVNVYTSYLLGRDGYALLDLGGSGVSWHQKGFKAETGDPLAQRATLGYKLWTGAKVLDPMAIVGIKSSSGYDVGIVADLTFDTDARPAEQVIDGIAIYQEPTTTDYITTDTELDLTGLIVTRVDAYGGQVILSSDDYEVTGAAFTAGTHEITVTYTLDAVDYTATFDIVVTSA